MKKVEKSTAGASKTKEAPKTAVKKEAPKAVVAVKKEAPKAVVAVKKEAPKKEAVSKEAPKMETEKNPPEVAEILKAEKEAPVATEKAEKFVPQKNDDFCMDVEEGFVNGIFGLYDPTRKDCQDCEKEYGAAFAACKYNTEGQAKEKAATKTEKAAKTPKEKAPKAPKEKKEKKVGVDINEFGHLIRSGAAALDAALIKGATMEELKGIRGAITSHFAHLRAKHSLEITETNNIWKIVR